MKKNHDKVSSFLSGTSLMFRDEELKELKEQSDKRIKELQHRCNQYSRLCEQHVRNLQKKNNEIWDLKYTIMALKDELRQAEKFNKMQD